MNYDDEKMTLHRESPCKVNLLLNVLGRRPDGFHELETIMHPVHLTDALSFERAASGIELGCNVPELPVDSRNLVHRAATAFLNRAGIQREGIRIHLEKRLPLAAGIGAGSANAAATLAGLNELFGSPLSEAELQELAVALGSDVPFFLQCKPALATGRGEQIQPLDFFSIVRGAAFLLVYPGFGVSTPWAYRSLARFPDALNGRPSRAQKLIAALNSGDLNAVGSELYNSLEAPVLSKYPLLQLFQDHLRELGAPAVRMSGSGSTTFALAPAPEAAEEWAARLKKRFGSQLWTAVAPVHVEG